MIESIKSEFGLASDIELFSGFSKIESLANISESSTIFASIPMVGGGKKRGGKKRKAYATPKKNKHKHQNVKLHALSYYALNKDTVEKVKKLCTQESCKDKGIFMANHWNRFYCGNCHITFEKINAPKE